MKRFAAALVIFATFAQVAVAQDRTPRRPDPDSPAGVEYQLPLERAREEAAGRGSSGRSPEGGESGPTGEAPELFGAGIRPPGRPRNRSNAGNGLDKDSGEAAAPGGTSSEGASGRAAASTTAAKEASGTLPTVGIVLAVVAAAGLLALVLRRLLREDA